MELTVISTNQKRLFQISAELILAQMSSMLSLQQYASSSEESNNSGTEDNGDEIRIHLKAVDQMNSLSSKISIVAAPDVVSKVNKLAATIIFTSSLPFSFLSVFL